MKSISYNPLIFFNTYLSVSLRTVVLLHTSVHNHVAVLLAETDCGDPAPDNGSSNTPKGTTYGETAIISCDEGYVLSGSAFITCEESGNWSDVATCQIKGDFIVFYVN